jgi:hypothetical protein
MLGSPLIAVCVNVEVLSICFGSDYLEWQVRTEILTAVAKKSTAFWDASLCTVNNLKGKTATISRINTVIELVFL